MKDKMQDLVLRLSNVGTIIAICSAILFILNNCGLIVDSEKIMNVITALCSIGVLLGILNNPKSSGIYLPFINGIDKEDEEDKGGDING